MGATILPGICATNRDRYRPITAHSHTPSGVDSPLARTVLLPLIACASVMHLQLWRSSYGDSREIGSFDIALEQRIRSGLFLSFLYLHVRLSPRCFRRIEFQAWDALIAYWDFIHPLSRVTRLMLAGAAPLTNAAPACLCFLSAPSFERALVQTGGGHRWSGETSTTTAPTTNSPALAKRRIETIPARGSCMTFFDHLTNQWPHSPTTNWSMAHLRQR